MYIVLYRFIPNVYNYVENQNGQIFEVIVVQLK